MNNTEEEIDGLINGYCADCSACGHGGCCSALQCKMTNRNEYCPKYLRELKYGYTCYEKMYSLIYQNQEKYPELFEAVETIRDDAEPSSEL
jgi:hypothetical protein